MMRLCRESRCTLFGEIW